MASWPSILASSIPPLLCQTELGRHQADIEAVRGEKLVMTAVIVDEGILQGEGREIAARLDVPGDLLDLRREPALRRMLLDDDDALMRQEGSLDAGAIERLHRVHGNDRDRLS